MNQLFDNLAKNNPMDFDGLNGGAPNSSSNNSNNNSNNNGSNPNNANNTSNSGNSNSGNCANTTANTGGNNANNLSLAASLFASGMNLGLGPGGQQNLQALAANLLPAGATGPNMGDGAAGRGPDDVTALQSLLTHKDRIYALMSQLQQNLNVIAPQQGQTQTQPAQTQPAKQDGGGSTSAPASAADGHVVDDSNGIMSLLANTSQQQFLNMISNSSQQQQALLSQIASLGGGSGAGQAGANFGQAGPGGVGRRNSGMGDLQQRGPNVNVTSGMNATTNTTIPGNVSTPGGGGMPTANGYGQNPNQRAQLQQLIMQQLNQRMHQQQGPARPDGTGGAPFPNQGLDSTGADWHSPFPQQPQLFGNGNPNYVNTNNNQANSGFYNDSAAMYPGNNAANGLPQNLVGRMPQGGSPATGGMSPNDLSAAFNGPSNTIWTPEEDRLLQEAMIKYPADKFPSIVVRYSKLAYHVRTKTVRDVATRLKYMQEPQASASSQLPISQPSPQQIKMDGTGAGGSTVTSPPSTPLSTNSSANKQQPPPQQQPQQPQSRPGGGPNVRDKRKSEQQVESAAAGKKQRKPKEGDANGFDDLGDDVIPASPVQTPTTPGMGAVPPPLVSSVGNMGQPQLQPQPQPTMQHRPRSATNAESQEQYINRLLEENGSIIGKIRQNLYQGNIRDNLELIRRFRDNIIHVLTCMSTMPGIMSQMPPIPVKLNTICIPQQQQQPQAIQTPPPQQHLHQQPMSMQQPTMMHQQHLHQQPQLNLHAMQQQLHQQPPPQSPLQQQQQQMQMQMQNRGSMSGPPSSSVSTPSGGANTTAPSSAAAATTGSATSSSHTPATTTTTTSTPSSTTGNNSSVAAGSTGGGTQPSQQQQQQQQQQQSTAQQNQLSPNLQPSSTAPSSQPSPNNNNGNSNSNNINNNNNNNTATSTANTNNTTTTTSPSSSSSSGNTNNINTATTTAAAPSSALSPPQQQQQSKQQQQQL